MKDWRSGVEIAVFFWVREGLAAAFVYALLCHFWPVRTIMEVDREFDI